MVSVSQKSYLYLNVCVIAAAPCADYQWKFTTAERVFTMRQETRICLHVHELWNETSYRSKCSIVLTSQISAFWEWSRGTPRPAWTIGVHPSRAPRFILESAPKLSDCPQFNGSSHCKHFFLIKPLNQEPCSWNTFPFPKKVGLIFSSGDSFFNRNRKIVSETEVGIHLRRLLPGFPSSSSYFCSTQYM